MNSSHIWQIKPAYFGGTLLLDFVRLAVNIAGRDIKAKYKRSLGGLCWAFLSPLATVGIYWTIFGVIFRVSWEDPLTQEKVGFILPFFAGLTFYLFFSDVVVSSAGLFIAKRNYVKKSAFPIWVLWLANMIRAVVHWSINIGILLILAILEQRLTIAGLLWTIPAILIGLIFIGAVSLLISCLGPFLGDIQEASGLVMRVVFYTAPVTYPLSIVPEGYRFFLWFNPLTHLIEPLRTAVLFSSHPALQPLLAFVLCSLALWGVSLWVFSRTGGVIADVV